jgi:hypothetical protein
MNKNVSIVPVDTRNYRTIARENWGLTQEQMRGKHVHHRIPRSRGGTNDPTNLYVCSPWFHKEVWHAEDSYNSLILYAEVGGREAVEQKKGIHGRTAEQRHDDAVKAGNAGGWEKSRSRQVGIFGDRTEWMDTYVECGRRAIAKLLEKNPNHHQEIGRKGAQTSLERGVGVNTPEARRRGGQAGGRIAVESGQLARARTPESIRKGAIAGANTKWMDPDHPELGVHNAGVLVRKQKKLGLPYGKENRKKVG